MGAFQADAKQIGQRFALFNTATGACGGSVHLHNTIAARILHFHINSW